MIADFYNNKIIWITGASAGIGKAVAIALSQFNTQLILSARNKEKLQETMAACQHDNIVVAEGDLSNKEINLNIAENIHNQYGQLDIALLNAGTCEYIDVQEFDSQIFEHVMSANFYSMVYGIEASLPLLRQSPQSQLVGMSSTAAYLGLPRSEAYGASKAAIHNMLSALRISLSAEKINVSVICPGFVETPLTDRNDFPMPGLITAEHAAQYIIKGIAGKQQEIHFPKRFSYTLKFIASLPNPILTWLLSKTVLKT